MGDGRFQSPNWGEVALQPYGHSTNYGTITADGGFIGLFLADGPLALGPTTFTNYGTMEATAQGGIDMVNFAAFTGVASAVFTNAGQLKANGGLIEIDSPVGASGSAVISNDGTIAIRYAGFAENTRFSPGSNGTLEIGFGGFADNASPGHAGSFTGTLSGFTTGDKIDLRLAANATLTFHPHGNTSGTLSVTDGTYSTTISLAGSYVKLGFHIGDDGSGSAVITYSPPGSSSTHAPPPTGGSLVNGLAIVASEIAAPSLPVQASSTFGSSTRPIHGVELRGLERGSRRHTYDRSIADVR